MKTVGCVALLSLYMFAVCVAGFLIRGRNLQEAVIAAGGAGLLVLLASLICACFDFRGEVRARKRVRKKLMARPDQGDESFLARFDAIRLSGAMEVRNRIAKYFHVDPQKIAADDVLDYFELDVLESDASNIVGFKHYSEWRPYFETIGDLIEHVVEREELFNTSPPRSSPN